LADVFLPPEAIDALAADFAAIRWTNDNVLDVRTLVHARAAQGLPAPSLSVLRPAIDDHFVHTAVGDVLKSLDGESRPEYADWAQQTAKLMRTRSPTMLSVARSLLRRGKSMELADCFRMELGMVEQCFEQGDFIEGIRALLIDKDNSPRWTPTRLEEVTDASVEAFFRERWRARSHPLADLERQRDIQ
jgi:enoyl-CoA hydratase/carnithine racemase